MDWSEAAVEGRDEVLKVADALQPALFRGAKQARQQSLCTQLPIGGEKVQLKCLQQPRIWRKEIRVAPAKGDEGVNSFLRNLKHEGGTIGVEQLRVSLLKSI